MTKLKRTTHKAKNFSKEEAQGYCLMPASHSAIAITNRLTGSQFRLWHYLMMIDSEADRNRNVASADVERQIQDRLKHELGGQTEVVTAVGRIDLLTSTEVIEIKEISDWKEALGKVLAYSAFKPEHSKRIHPFGKPDLTKLALAQATGSEFDVVVTFEEVCGE
ncbi:hypothetical protein WA1_50130 [Scytonema hofmannii PCC 7110]|uniref:Uncharacterized protein n=1 Tax=Scytonema hofmannii PCC 7110 TaxID=128403 RepID=A0A139WR54_9CYAN|nr:hypothetical protein [Scytonema hofmannii]KYC34887.1 hypothetical protein WA1_50130 [Scytonema hofmannii PCC 7110]